MARIAWSCKAQRAAWVSTGVIAAAFASASVGEAQKVAPAAVEMRVTEWQDATRMHTRGQFDDVAAVVARWPPDLTRVVVDQVIQHARERLANRRVEMLESDRTELRTTLARGLVLHTDIAIAERTTEINTAAGRQTLRVLDAKLVRAQRFSIHWGLARLLADALAREPVTAPIALSWYRAVGALFQQWADLGQLFAHLKAASDALPEDPVLLLYRGSLHQAHADPRVQVFLEPYLVRHAFRITRGGMTAAEERQTGLTPAGVRPGAGGLPIEEPSVELGTAERFLRQALALDASLAEAHIRLAHVLDTRGKTDEALPHARQALSSPLPEYLDYYGAMVLGRVADRLGHAVEARMAFERAAARYPQSQAAQVALSRVALTEGRGLEAVEALVASFGPASDPADDPWSQYFRVHEPGAAERLHEFRRIVP